MERFLSHLSSNRQPRRSLQEGVAAEIRRVILEGDWPPGTRLPNEIQLADAMQVSRGTLRAALDALAREGLIVRRHGIGTFVTERRSLLLNNLDINLGITELVEHMGLKPGCSYMKCEIVSAEKRTADQLDVPLGARLVRVERVRTADSQPVVFSTDLFAERLLGGTTLEELDSLLNTKHSLYAVFEQDLGLLIDHGVATITPVGVSALDLAEKLSVEENAVFLHIAQTDYNRDGQPLLHSNEYHRADFTTFTVYRKRYRSTR